MHVSNATPSSTLYSPTKVERRQDETVSNGGIVEQENQPQSNKEVMAANEQRIDESIAHLREGLQRYEANPTGIDFNEDLMRGYFDVLNNINRLDVEPQEKERLIKKVRDSLPELASKEADFVEYNDDKFDSFARGSIENYRQAYEQLSVLKEESPEAYQQGIAELGQKYLDLKFDIKNRYANDRNPERLNQLLLELDEACPVFNTENSFGL